MIDTIYTCDKCKNKIEGIMLTNINIDSMVFDVHAVNASPIKGLTLPRAETTYLFGTQGQITYQLCDKCSREFKTALDMFWRK